MTHASTRVGVDIGGTFTDVALSHHDELTTCKVLTDYERPEQAILEGIAIAAEKAGVPLPAIGQVIHGTTLVTNALIERRGARLAFITTEGFRDIIEVGYESRYDQYDLMIEKPVPLVPRHLRLTVPERVDVAGRVLTPLDEAAVEALVPTLTAEGVGSIAVGFLHEHVAGVVPAIPLFLGRGVWAAEVLRKNGVHRRIDDKFALLPGGDDIVNTIAVDTDQTDTAVIGGTQRCMTADRFGVR